MENYDGYHPPIPIFRFAMRRELSGQPQYFPKRGTERASGWDVCAAPPKAITLRAGQYAKIPLGFKVFPPDGWWLELRPRSSTFAKKQLHCLYGVIDEDYEGECLFACQYIPDISSLGNDITIASGEAIGQLIPVQRREMKVEMVTNEEYEKLCKERNTSRGQGGFGSTGR
jgi:deoxyuridine 5'-triphosphate nucleotidohydrolase